LSSLHKRLTLDYPLRTWRSVLQLEALSQAASQIQFTFEQGRTVSNSFMYYIIMLMFPSFIPEERSEPPRTSESLISSIADAMEDTPIYQLATLVFRQLIGFQLYLAFNVSGQRRYPRWTSHYNRMSFRVIAFLKSASCETSQLLL
jgi:hypothetical protein